MKAVPGKRAAILILQSSFVGIGIKHYLCLPSQEYCQAERVELSSPREFFEGTRPGLDASLFTAEAGSAWTLLYPKFAVAEPQPGLLSLPLAYAVARGDQELGL
jgi:hypothetical protein